MSAAGEIRLRLRREPDAISKRHTKGEYAKHMEVARSAKTAVLDDSSKLRESASKVAKEKIGFGGIRLARRFTKHATKLVREGCAVIDQRFGRNALFLTATLPGGTIEAYRTLAAYSGYVIDLLNHWFKYTAPDCWSLGVWEWQGRGALHSHHVLAHHDPQILEKVQSGFHLYWCSIIEKLSDKTGVDLFEMAEVGTWRGNREIVQTKVVRIEKSVGRYLSKYLSKATSKLSSFAHFPPANWWTLSKQVRLAVMAARRAVGSVSVGLRTAVDWYEALQGTTAGVCAVEFNYTNVYAPSDRYCILYPAEGEAATVWRQVAAQLRSYSAEYELPPPNLAHDLSEFDSRDLSVLGIFQFMEKYQGTTWLSVSSFFGSGTCELPRTAMR